MVLTHWCMVTYVSDLSHQLETEEQISVKIESRYNNFLSSKKTFENVCKMAAFDTTMTTYLLLCISSCHFHQKPLWYLRWLCAYFINVQSTDNRPAMNQNALLIDLVS